MASVEVLKRTLTGELRLARGRVAGHEPDGRVRVRTGAEPGQEIACDVLTAGTGAPARFRAGDDVLIARPEPPLKPGIILGAVGPARAAAEARALEAASPGRPLELRSREIVIEAGDELILRCGQASIRITRDGKIVIRGEHILSRAKGTQRIKGGSVAIN